MRYAAIVPSILLAITQRVLAQDHSPAHSAHAGELNHYPVPLHALELADALQRTAEQ